MKKTAAFYGMATALALLVSYVETLIPVPVGIPGAKLGLTNIVIVIVLYLYDAKTAAGISVLRIVLSGFLFGNLFGIFYSLAGGMLSLLCMAWLKRSGAFGMRGVSMAGGVTHNLGQLAVAACVVENFQVLYYVPALVLAGVLTGYAIGIAAQEIRKRIKV